MDKERIIELSKMIHVIRPFYDPIAGVCRYAVQPQVDPFKHSCIWDAPIVGKEVINVKLVSDNVFHGEHTYGHPSLFKPSMSEVLQAIPEDLIGKFNAVTINSFGFTDDKAKHLSSIKLYKVDIVDVTQNRFY